MSGAHPSRGGPDGVLIASGDESPKHCQCGRHALPTQLENHSERDCWRTPYDAVKQY